MTTSPPPPSSRRKRRFQHRFSAVPDSADDRQPPPWRRQHHQHPLLSVSVSTVRLLLTTFTLVMLLLVFASCCTVAAAEASMDAGDRTMSRFRKKEPTKSSAGVGISNNNNLRRQQQEDDDASSSSAPPSLLQQLQHETSPSAQRFFEKKNPWQLPDQYEPNQHSLLSQEKKQGNQQSDNQQKTQHDVAENSSVPETSHAAMNQNNAEQPLVVDLTKFPQQEEEEEEKAAADRHRSLAAVGRRTVLVVRILDARASPPEDAERTQFITDTILKVLFQGIPGNPDYPSVKEQFYQCSAGQLDLEPTPWGVMTVTVTVDYVQDREAWRQTAAQVVMERLVGTTDTTTPYLQQLRTLAHHVAIILPDTYIETADPNFRATGEIYNTLSTFSSAWAVSTSAYLHEFGHNLGLNHAAYADDIYGDTTSYMGVSQGESYLPRKCYNAAQHWALGWYPRHRVSIALSELQQQGPRRVALAGFVHHASTDRAVLVELPGNVYLQLNLAQSYNSGVGMFRDQVVVVAKNPNGSGTTLVAALSSWSSYSSAPEYRYYATQGTTTTPITVALCRYENEVADVSVAVGEVAADCNSAVEVRPESSRSNSNNAPVVEAETSEGTTVAEAPPEPNNAVDPVTTTTTTTTWVALPVPAAPGPETREQQQQQQFRSPPSTPPPPPPPTREPTTTTDSSWNSFGNSVGWFGKPATTFTSSSSTSSAVSPLSSAAAEPPVVQQPPSSSSSSSGADPVAAASAANADDSPSSEELPLSARDWIIVAGAGSAMLIVTALVARRRRRRRDLWWFSTLDDDAEDADDDDDDNNEMSFEVEVSYDDGGDDDDAEAPSSSSSSSRPPFWKRNNNNGDHHHHRQQQHPSTPTTDRDDITSSSCNNSASPSSWLSTRETIEILLGGGGGESYYYNNNHHHR